MNQRTDRMELNFFNDEFRCLIYSLALLTCQFKLSTLYCTSGMACRILFGFMMYGSVGICHKPAGGPSFALRTAGAVTARLHKFKVWFA